MKNKLFKSALAVTLAFSMSLTAPVLAAQTDIAPAVQTEITAESSLNETDTAQTETSETKDTASESESSETKDTTSESESSETNDTTSEPESSETNDTTSESESSGTLPYEEDSTEAFVARLYDTLLLRPADEKGLAEWTTLLENHKATGADIIKGFIESKEFKEQNYSDEAYITYLTVNLMQQDLPSGLKYLKPI